MPEVKEWPPGDTIQVGEVMFTDLTKWKGPDVIKGATGRPMISVSGLLARYVKDAMDQGHLFRVKGDGKIYRVRGCAINTRNGISDFVLEEVDDEAAQSA